MWSIEMKDIVSNLLTRSQIAPGPNDLRGPCPGINVMANHGYIPRNGISTVTQMTQAANEGLYFFAP
jgi:hypothetical protein